MEVDPLDAEQTFPTDEEIDQAVQERALKMVREGSSKQQTNKETGPNHEKKHKLKRE